MNFFGSQQINEAPWALANAKGASFLQVSKDVAGSAISQKERAVVQELEDRIGLLTQQYLKLCDPVYWDAH